MKQSPYFDINYGWPYGADGWNTQMDENLLVLSFLPSHQVLSIVDSVPATPNEGASYVVSSDNSARFYTDGAWYIFYPADGWEFRTLADGLRWRFEGGVPVQQPDTNDLSEAVDQLFSGLGDVTTRLGAVEDEMVELDGIPQRVQTLEETSARQEDLLTLDGEVQELSLDVEDLSTQLPTITSGISGLQSSFSDLQGVVDGKLDGIVAGDGITVDNTDPTNPVVSVDSTVTIDLINERMSAAARAAIDALDPATATLSDLITALQS